MPEDLIAQIRAFFKGEIDNTPADLNTYSHDASLFKIQPQLIVFPKDSEDIKNLVKFVAQAKQQHPDLSLTVRSAGTDMSGGPLNPSIIVDMTRHFNQILQIGEGFAVTQPGVFYRDFEKETLKHHLLLPTFPASRELCTVGGMVANNSGGEKTLTYGKTEDYLLSLKVVLEDGQEYLFKPLSEDALKEKIKGDSLQAKIYKELYKLLTTHYKQIKDAKPDVSKNSAGYYLWNVYDKEQRVFDPCRLIVGSQGTFGIITEIKFRLIKPKPYSRLLIIFLKNLDNLGPIANHVLQFKPESFESFDDHTLQVAIKFFPEIIKIMGGNFLKMALSFLPEFWMVVSGGVPKMILLAQFTGDTTEEALQKAEAAQKSLVEFKFKTEVTKTEEEAKKYWTFRRESFNLLRHKMRGLRTAPFIDDFVVKPEHLPQFLPELNQILSRYKIIYTIAGHVGDGNFHIIPLMNMTDPASLQIIEKLSQEVYPLVLKYKGSITGEHNDGLIRSPFLAMMYGEKVYQLFVKTKQLFDPLDIFNPNKKVGVNLNYAFSHIDTSPPVQK